MLEPNSPGPRDRHRGMRYLIGVNRFEHNALARSVHYFGDHWQADFFGSPRSVKISVLCRPIGTGMSMVNDKGGVNRRAVLVFLDEAALKNDCLGAR